MSDNVMKSQIIQSTIPLAIGVVLAAIIGGYFAYAGIVSKSKYSISVTGLATRHVKSDQAVLGVMIKRAVKPNELAAGYAVLEADQQKVTDVLKKHGLDEKVDYWTQIENTPVYGDKNALQRHDLQVGVEITTTRIDEIRQAVADIDALNITGTNAQEASLEYNYSKLQELRISLLSESMQDARARAEKILEGTGQHIGRVIDASVGPVQVLGKHSDSTSDYSNLDTSSIEKDIVITVRATFAIQ